MGPPAPDGQGEVAEPAGPPSPATIPSPAGDDRPTVKASRKPWLWGCGGLLALGCFCGLWALALFWLLGRVYRQEDGRGADAPAAEQAPAAASGASPAEGAASGSPRRGGTLVLPGGAPNTLDPALVRDVSSASYMYEIYSGLVTLSPDLQVVPDLAERWEISADGRRYTFHLRDGTTFHDGAALTSDAIVFAIERACDARTGSVVAPVYLGDIVGCQEKLAGERQTVIGLQNPDARTVIIDIDSPKAYFLAKLTYPTAFALDPLQLERDQDWARHPNGSGPFRLAEWTEDEQILLERYAAYYGEGPYLDRVVFDLRPISAETRYEAGELDAIGVGTSDIQRVADPLNPLSDQLQLGVGELGLSYLGFDVRVPPFDDRYLRRALNLAVDKERLSRVLLEGTAVPVWGLLPPGLPGFDPDLSPYRFDAEAARAELRASRYGGPEAVPPITLFASGGGGDPLMDAVVDSINEVLGLSIQIEQASWELFEEELTGGRYPFFALGWSADYPDAQDFLDVLLHSGSALNHGGYANAEADALLEQARVEPDETRRIARYQEAERLMLEDAPWVPLFTGREAWLVAPYVKGFSIPPLVLPRMQWVWLTADAPSR
ncbi:MAG: ABC transporter substrate-binding protein [Anaerolineae bacterium]|jgi:ABC-type transport system substrate-binding protein|nr:peptide ABC transporter substrate-binding protein [Ardenticatenia bacterium]HQZ70455.1 peptide ABC transporter substrate-binding protein [Anaerolineae bacterium]